MSLIGSIGSVAPSQFGRVAGPNLADAPHAASLGKLVPGGAQPGEFGAVFDTLVSAVDAKQQQAGAITRQVLLGDNDQLHQSVIAMQEASVAFSLMVEVRNKLDDSYQELMRMPV